LDGSQHLGERDENSNNEKVNALHDTCYSVSKLTGITGSAALLSGFCISSPCGVYSIANKSGYMNLFVS